MGYSDCIFCRRQAVVKNTQGFPVCVVHRSEALPDMNCVCGNGLSVKDGKYGAFFLCPDCGPISLKKVLDINLVEKESPPREITMTSDEMDLM
jgi:predicted RNA-binding Zn-ribbon protein involved in translation (DUF1610 family)